MPQYLANNLTDGELCLFVGFQARSKVWNFDETRNTLQVKPLCYLSTVRKASWDRFSIRLDQKVLQRSAVGKLNGISGSAVFVLRNDRPSLAGILVEYRAVRSEIVVTSSGIIRRLLEQM